MRSSVLRAEPRSVRSCSASAAVLQLGDRRDPELLPDPRGGLRAEARQPHEEDDLGGTSALRFVSAWISPSSTIWTIFSSIVLPIPGSSFACPVERELGDGAGRLADRVAARR